MALTIDILMCALAVRLAFYLRLEIWYGWERAQIYALIGSVALATPIFIMSGLYRAIFRHGGSRLLSRVGAACLIYALCYGFAFTVWKVPLVPRSIGVLQPLLLFALIAISRGLASWWLGEEYNQARRVTDIRRVAIYGAGSAGRQLLQALERSPMRVVAFIDDDKKLWDQVMLGRRVYGHHAIPQLVASEALTDVLLAIPSASRRRRSAIIESLRPMRISVRTLPGLSELADGKVTLDELHSLDVDDLLGRARVEPDESLFAKNIRDKVVVVTGAGGSIGSELCRQIIHSGPQTLLLIENSELALYNVHHELEEWLLQHESRTRIVPLLGSVCDAERISSIFAAWRPNTIYHAAAYKHVPLVECNPAEGVWNNAFGTLTVAQAAIGAEVGNFVCVSTDKAVRPTNVMGATKRLAEICLQALAATGTATRFSMVRFGNVLGSSGSVVPKFRDQIRKGGPITITHPGVNRYFMTIPEASQLVIQAGAMASGGEVFVLDMGEPVMIVDLARRVVELSGLTVADNNNPEGDIPFEFIGLRPGEKLHEELLIGNDPSPTEHTRIMKAHEHFIEWSVLEGALDELRAAVDTNDISGVLELLTQLVTEYRRDIRVHDHVYRQNTAA